MAHWKHTATRCAVEGCEATRVKGWSTCRDLRHHALGKSLYGAGRIAPIPAPEERPLWRYVDARGVSHVGYHEGHSDFGGTDIVYRYRDAHTGELSIVSGSLIADAKRVA